MYLIYVGKAKLLCHGLTKLFKKNEFTAFELEAHLGMCFLRESLKYVVSLFDIIRKCKETRQRILALHKSGSCLGLLNYTLI